MSNAIAPPDKPQGETSMDAEMLLSSVKNTELLFCYYVFGVISIGFMVTALVSERAGWIFTAAGIAVIGHAFWVGQNFSQQYIKGEITHRKTRNYVVSMELNSLMLGALWVYLAIYVMPHTSSMQWTSLFIALCLHIAIVGVGLSLVGFCFYINAAMALVSVITSGGVLWGSEMGLPAVPAVVTFTGFMLVIHLRGRDIGNLTKSLLRSREEARSLVVLLEKAQKQAVNAASVKDQFLANISHEIRNPMQSILGTLELFSDQNERSQDCANALSGAIASCRHLNEMMTQLLDTASISSEGRQNRPHNINITEIAKEVIQTHRVKSMEKNVPISLKVSPSFHPWVLLDPSLLRIVLNNLIANAVKFTPQGEISVMLDSEMIFNGEGQGKMQKVIIEVADTGIGVPKEKMENLFDGRSRGQNAIDMRLPGTGLGLEIVNKTVTHYFGGRVIADSKLNEGTSFILEIPAQKVNRIEVADVRPRPTKSRLRGKILLVEDNPSILIACRILIERMGLDCHVAEDGQKAIDAVILEQFDVIMMDCHMPGVDGFEATRLIREIERQSGRPRQVIVAVTADVSQEDRNHVISSGMDSHLPKPYEAEAVHAMLSQYVDSELHLPREFSEIS